MGQLLIFEICALARAAQRARARDLGYKKGVPDLLIFERRGQWGGMAVELKRRGGRCGPSLEQTRWLSNLRAKGYYAVVCFGFEDAKDAISRYLADVEPRAPTAFL